MITRTTYILAIVIAFAVIGVVINVVARDQYFNYDESLNLTASKTLASTGMYATELNGEYIRYDPTVTTGPTVVVPMALAIRAFGATPGVVRGTLIVLCLVYLVMACWAAREIFGDPVAFAFLIVMTTTPYVLQLGVSAQGDLPSICLALFALALLDRADRVTTKRSRLLILAAASLSLALAVLAKDILMLMVLSAMAVVGIDFLRSKTRARAPSHGIAILIALGIVLGWRGYQYVAMRLTSPVEFAKWTAIAKDIGNMVGTHIVYRPLSHTRQAWLLAWDLFAPYLLGFIAGLLAIWLLRYVFRLPTKWINWESSAQKTILATAALWCLWYFIISGPEASNRHLLLGVVFLELLALNFAWQLWSGAGATSFSSVSALPTTDVDVVKNPGARNAIWYVYPIAGVLTGLMIWGVWYGITYNQQAHRDSKSMLLSQLEAVKWVETNMPKDSAISGWGWYVPWHISFLADRKTARANIHSASLQGITDWLLLPPEISVEGANERRQSFLARQGSLEYSGGGYEIYRISHRSEDQPKTTEQLSVIARNAKKWKADGHNYSELNRTRAIADGLIPLEMIINGGIQNLFGGPVDISPAPLSAGIPDTFLVLFSGVPNDECVKLAFPPPNDFVVYAGNFLKLAGSEEEARSLCTTGNMWFIAK